MVRNYKRKTEDRWSKEDLLEALICIKEAKLKINDAARQYGISRATLYRQYQKFILAGGKCDVNQFRTCGGNPILTKVEEDVLEKTIRDLREQGFTVTSSDIKRICFEYCDSNGIPNQFNQEKRMASDDWYYGFLKRHPDVRIPKPGGSGQKSLPIPGSAGGANSSGDIDDILSSADKMGKPKKNKSSPTKKLIKHERTSPSKSPVHIIPTLSAPSEVTADQRANHNFHEQAPILIPHDAEARQLKKPLKRLSGKGGGKSRGRKPTSSVTLQTIPIQMEDEYVKAEVDDTEDNEDDEDQMLDQDQEQSEVMETEEADEEEDDDEDDDEEEEEDEEEDAADEHTADNADEGDDQEEETEDVEMADEDDEEQDEAEKSESEEEEEVEGEEDDAEADDDEDAEEAEGGEEQEDEDAEADNDAEEGDAEEGDEDEDEDEEEEEEEDEDENDDEENGESHALTAENDDSGSEVDCTNDDELLEKLLDM